MRRLILLGAPLVAVCVGTAILLHLGFWQLERGTEKQAIKEALDSRIDQEPLKLRGQQLDVAKDQFYRAEVSGFFEHQREVLIDNRIVNGQGGLNVITPLKIDGIERRVLVNRGWIPWSFDRTRYAEYERPMERVVLSGLLVHPAQDYYSLDSSLPDPKQKVWQNLDLSFFEPLRGIQVEPLVLWLPEDPASGFRREWPQYNDEWAARHRGYALQWFGMAAVLVIIYLVALVRRWKRSST